MQDERTLGEKVADKIAEFGGSWTFIITFFMALIIWMFINSKHLSFETFDPYPFILLNLCLSCLAAIQAPIIMMSQNRQAAKDRKNANKDLKLSYDINEELQRLHTELNKEILDLRISLKHNRESYDKVCALLEKQDKEHETQTLSTRMLKQNK